jgi:uncharacterized protein YbgA (DUF1722 family)/uncharacterized protein YbbK (DUF523 family)
MNNDTANTHEAETSATAAERIRVGASSCLLGNPVRYDGGHKLDRYVAHALARWLEFVPVCPEVECGLGVPREAMRLQGDPAAPRLVTNKTGVDHTERMLAWAAQRVEELAAEELCGFIFKSKSPSSGMERVKVYGDAGMPAHTGVGLFARAFKERFPLLPVEEEGRLNDPGLRENFIERLFVMRRWRRFLDQAAARPARAVGLLVDFHTRHKLQIMAHSPEHYRTMGKLVAQAKELPAEELAQRYQGLLLPALARLATPKKHANVLQHIMGYFKKQLDPADKAELLDLIERHRQGQLPLVVPVTLAAHYVRKFDVDYLAGQHYLEPHPVELGLRNRV